MELDIDLKHAKKLTPDLEALTWLSNRKGYANKVLTFGANIGNLDVIKIAVNAGANIHHSKDIVLRWGARHNKIDIMEYVRQNSNTKKLNYKQALSWALKYKNLDACKWIKKYASDWDKIFKIVSKSAVCEFYSRVIKTPLMDWYYQQI